LTGQRGTPYLAKTLGPPLLSVIGSDISFEIDDNKLSGEPTAKKENLNQLLSFAECILATINTSESVLDMPREIKALAYFIKNLADKYAPDNTMLLVGGFIMLRFINPALLAPDFYYLVQPGSLSLGDRRNLTLLCKLIQNISNQRLCNEEWMLDCNPYIEENLKRLEEFYVHVLMDPHQENEEQEPFKDILNEEGHKDKVNAEEIDLEGLVFFDEIVRERKLEIMEIFSRQPHKIRTDEDALELVGLLNDYGERQLPEINLELYYSPLCPFSRAVWLFCLQTEIPIVLHKIDLLKEDQALDQEYKKFSQLSPSMQVPLLIDGDFVIEESAAICMYLCDRYFVAKSWLPKADIASLSRVQQVLDWMQRALQVPVLRLWNDCKDPSQNDIQLKRYGDLLENLEVLNSFYQKEEKRCSSGDVSTPYYQGTQPSLVDLFITLILSFGQLLQGFSISQYPYLKQAYFQFANQFCRKTWKQINYEFEGFFKYVITAISTGNTQRIRHSVLFQETPHTIYEMIQDPDNDIFLFLASKTISIKTNAKLKRGLKRLNTEGGESSGNADETDDEPYLVNLEIGGEFNINGREGTNLLLVPGKKIVQTSRMSTWEAGVASTCIFEFETTSNSQALLHFTELNCPSENSKVQEEYWNKFWKKINGVRVEAIEQTLYFKGKTTEFIYEALSDWKVLARVLKSKVKIEANGAAYIHNNKAFAYITHRIPNKQVVQQWRSTDWPEDLFSKVTLDLEPFEGGCRVHWRIGTVPLDRSKAVEKLWKSNMWKKLGGVVCCSLQQNIALQMPAQEARSMWLNDSILSQKIKSKCMTGGNVGSPFAVHNLKGEWVEIGANTLTLRASHKDWPQHPSMVTFTFCELEKGTEMMMNHQNIPINSLKTVSDMWNIDFWAKMEAVAITDVSTSTMLNSMSPEVVYRALTDRNSLSTITGSECLFVAKEGGAVSMYEKLVKGTVTSLHKNSGIVMSIRYFNWPFNHYSDMVYQLDEINGGKGTLLTINQQRVPISNTDEVLHRCEDFCKSLKQYKFPSPPN